MRRRRVLVLVAGAAAVWSAGLVAVPGAAVSCPSPGNCAAGGFYRDSHIRDLGFVVSETNGVWGEAIEVPGLAALNKGDAFVSSVSCTPSGSCVAGGSYADRSGSRRRQGFVT